MANGQNTPVEHPDLRAAAPHQGGPLGSSGAAPLPPTPPATPEATPPAPEATTPPPATEPAAPEATEPAAAASSPSATASPGSDPAAVADKSDKEQAAKDGPSTAPTAVVPVPAVTAPPPAPGGARRAKPVQAVKQAGRTTADWAKRPSGRLILPAIVALLLLGAAGVAGAYLVPQALEAAPTPSATPLFPGAATTASAPAASLPAGLPTQSAPAAGPTGLTTATTPPAVTGQNGGRPADALAGWAEQVGTKVGIPVVAVQAYGYAELVVSRTTPSCHLSWTTIAALAKVESSHGSANGAVLGADGSVQPPIYGLPLDGKGGRQLINDTDQGTLDGDTTFDRAVGPLQFIPATWATYKVDADNNGFADPNDIDDASLTAATYLCLDGRDLSKAASWWDAILSYNAVQPYAQKVFEAANDYGQRSR